MHQIMQRKIIRIAFLAVAIGFIVVACARVPITGRQQLQLIPAESLLSMSFQQYEQFLSQSELSEDDEAVATVQKVGRDIAAAVEKYMRQNGMEDQIDHFEWEFHLIEDEAVNAFAMPGGKVVVYTGILDVAENEDGLATVIGHEIAHVIANHGNERMSQGLVTQLGGIALSTALSTEPAATRQLFLAAYGVGAQVGVLLPYSRLQESESDHLGLIFMAMAGYDPWEAADFWKRMTQAKEGPAPPEFLSTHPAGETRIENIRNLIPEAMEYYDQAGTANGELR